MLNKFKRYVAEEKLWKEGQKLLLALSGGVDSVVLADLLSRAGCPFAIAHVNFKLRAEAAEQDAQFCRALAQQYQVDFYLKEVDTYQYAHSKGVSIQLAAREIRYAWFAELMQKHHLPLLLTAHHADDLVETIFFNLSRGAGLAGSRGILPKKQSVVRPLLFSSKAEILAYAKAQKLSWRTDQSNESDKYSRNFIRHHVVPQLRQLNPSLHKSVGRFAQRMADAEQFIEKEVSRSRNEFLTEKNGEIRISIDGILSEVSPRLILHGLLQPYGFNYSQVADLLKAQQSGRILQSDTHRLLRDREDWLVKPLPKETSPSPKEIIIDARLAYQNLSLEDQIISVEKLPIEGYQIPKLPQIASLDADLVGEKIVFRKWKAGDFFYPFGMKGKKKVSDFLTDLKLSIYEKEKIWVATNGQKLMWIVGLRPDRRFTLNHTLGTKSVSVIQLKLEDGTQ